MNTLKQIAIAATLAAAASTAGAQIPALVPVPFGQVYAGIVPGGSSTQCSSSVDYPTATGAHLGDGCLATQALLSAPYSATVDSLGNVYIGDYNDYVLRVVYQGGTALAAAIVAANPTNPGLVPTPGHIYTLAGSRTAALASTGSPKAYYCNGVSGQAAITSNGDNCPATESYIKPRTVALDKDGNVYFTSASGSSPIRVVYVQGTAAANLISVLDQGKVAQPGFIYSIIRSAASGYAGDGLLATASAVQAYSFRDVAVDSNYNIYMSDGTNAFTAPAYASNNNIRMVNGTTGIISTFAGSGGCTEPNTAGCAGTFTGDGGPATSATFNSPYAIFVDPNNNLYIADYNNGRLRVVYNSGAVPGLSNLTPGDVYTVAGGGSSTTSGILATQVAFATLFNAGIDSAGNLYAQDGTGKSLWRIDAKTGIATIIGNISPVATAGNSCGTGTGLTSSDKLGSGCPATEEALSASGRLSFDANGNFYEDESSNAVVRKFSYNNVFPGTAAGSTAKQSLAFVAPTAGAIIKSETYGSQGAASADFSATATGNCALNTALAAGVTCVLPASFTPARAGLREGSFTITANSTAFSEFLSGAGVAANASVDPASTLAIGTGITPNGVAADLLGNVYVSDSSSGKVFSAPVSGGTLAAAVSGLSSPAQVAVDGKGGIYVADTGNNRIAYAATSGATVTALGSGLKSPTGVAVDGQGDLFIADTGNNRIVEIPSVAGNPGTQFTLNITGLSAPGALTIDPSGDLFIADTGNSRIVEVPANNTQVALNLGTTAFAPLGLAVDPAGDIYIADSNSLTVLEFPVGSTLSNQLLTGLKTPKGLAVDASGSIYVADAGRTGILAANRAVPPVAYSPTNVGQSNIASVNVTSTGNAPLSFNSATLTSATGNTADFSIAASQTNGCALATPLAPGAQCALTATFAPLVKSPALTETATLLTNAPAAAVSGAVLTGAGVQLVSTSTTLAVTSPTSSTINYAQNVVVTATITPASNAGAAPTGNIIFSVDGKTQPTQSLTGSTGTLNLTSPGVGTHVVTVSYTGDSNYASSSASLSFTIAKAATATTLAIAPGISAGVTSLTFTAKVASTTATGATGTVSLYAGTTLITTQALGTSGSVTFSTTTTNYGSYQFSAVYSGDANFATSTSSTLSPAPDFSEAPVTSSFSTAQGGVATESINITPLYNYSGTVTASCSGLPANSVCRFNPVSLAVSGGTSQVLQVLVYTNVTSTISENRAPVPAAGKRLIAFALLFPAALWARRRRLPPLLLALVAIAALSGCQSAGNFDILQTPTGSSSITVTVTDSNADTHSQAITLNVYTP
jgi:sugar lactone lactonase YvrE